MYKVHKKGLLNLLIASITLIVFHNQKSYNVSSRRIGSISTYPPHPLGYFWTF